jgi:hypothetical protein
MATASPRKITGSIRRNILKWMLALTLIPMLIVSMLAIGLGINGIQNELHSKLQVIARLKTDSLNFYLRDKEASLRSLTHKIVIDDHDLLVSVLDDFRLQQPAFEALALVYTQDITQQLYGQIDHTLSQTLHDHHTNTYFYFHDRQPYLAIVTPVQQIDELVLIGWLNLDSIDAIIQEPMDGHRTAYLLKSQGELHYVSQLPNVPTNPSDDLLNQIDPDTDIDSSPLVYYPDIEPVLGFPGFTNPTSLLAWLYF